MIRERNKIGLKLCLGLLVASILENEVKVVKIVEIDQIYIKYNLNHNLITFSL